jgi:peptidoglycan/LPS O-acetylase OafA/YrhL
MLEEFPPALLLQSKIPAIEAFAVTRFGSGRPFWTLAVEWWLYMAFGWTLLAGPSRKQAPVRFYAVLAFVAIVPAFHAVSGHGNGISLAWIVGLVACLLLWTRPETFRAGTYYTASLCFAVLAGSRTLVIPNAYDQAFGCMLGLSLFALVFGLQQSKSRPAPGLIRSVRYLADYSYSLYLTHYTVLELFMLHGARCSPWVSLVVSFLGANVVALGIASITEMRHRSLNAWIRRRCGLA